MSNIVHVAVGVICSNAVGDNAEGSQVNEPMFFLTKRHKEVHQGGKWEFPGGKIESGETVAQALFRELKEEVAIEILSYQELMTIVHDYGDKKVCLEVCLVDNYAGEPSAQEGQQQVWQPLASLRELDFPQANLNIINQLESHFS